MKLLRNKWLWLIVGIVLVMFFVIPALQTTNFPLSDKDECEAYRVEMIAKGYECTECELDFNVWKVGCNYVGQPEERFGEGSYDGGGVSRDWDISDVNKQKVSQMDETDREESLVEIACELNCGLYMRLAFVDHMRFVYWIQKYNGCVDREEACKYEYGGTAQEVQKVEDSMSDEEVWCLEEGTDGVWLPQIREECPVENVCYNLHECLLIIDKREADAKVWDYCFNLRTERCYKRIAGECEIPQERAYSTFSECYDQLQNYGIEQAGLDDLFGGFEPIDMSLDVNVNGLDGGSSGGLFGLAGLGEEIGSIFNLVARYLIIGVVALIVALLLIFGLGLIFKLIGGGRLFGSGTGTMIKYLNIHQTPYVKGLGGIVVVIVLGIIALLVFAL